MLSEESLFLLGFRLNGIPRGDQNGQ
jgi:hypothetical protein